MKKLKNLFIIFFLVVFGLAAMSNSFNNGSKIISPVSAEDEEEEREGEDEEDREDEEDEEDEDDRFEVIDTNPGNKEIKKSETKTITTKLSDTVTQITTTTIRHDSDGDGKYDEEDPHPTINEYFIVKDDNLNGIDDQYEK
jgi:flagellar basal body-associated protein FliL